MPIFEPGLAELVAKNVREERLFFSTSLVEPAKAADAIFIAVGTPSRRGDGHADLSYVFKASREIADVLNGYKAGRRGLNWAGRAFWIGFCRKASATSGADCVR